MLEVLQSYAVFFPILFEMGTTLGRPVGIVIDEIAQARAIITNLSRMAQMLDINGDSNFLNKLLTDTTSEAIGLIYLTSHGYKTVAFQKNIAAVIEAAATGKIAGKDAKVATFIFFEKYIPEYLKTSMFEVDFTDYELSPACDIYSLMPTSDDVNMIIANQEFGKESENLPLLKSVEFLMPQLYRKGEIQFAKKLRDAAHKLHEDAMMAKEMQDFADVVENEMIRFIADKKVKVIKAEALDSVDESYLKDRIVIQGQNLYIAETAFKMCVQNLLKYIGINELKHRLTAEGLLIGKAGEYTSKLYFRCHDDLKCFRLLKFNLDKMAKMRELTM